jgi:ribosome-binding factor A
MAVDRLERVNALLRREIGEALYHVFNGEIDLAAVTITRVETARNLRTASVSVSVFGHQSERGRILRALADKHAALQAMINRDCHLKYTPRLRFILDTSIEKGDHILALLGTIDGDVEDDGDRSESP